MIKAHFINPQRFHGSYNFDLVITDNDTLLLRVPKSFTDCCSSHPGFEDRLHNDAQATLNGYYFSIYRDAMDLKHAEELESGLITDDPTFEPVLITNFQIDLPEGE